MKTAIKFGMNLHNRNYEAYPAADLEKNLDACKELGMEIVRLNRVCLNSDDYEEVEKASKLCHERDMKLMLVLDNQKMFRGMSLDERELKMAEYYKELSSKLRDKVDYYQLFNELDVGAMNAQIADIFKPGNDGKVKSDYDSVAWEHCIAIVKGALRGMKEGYPEGKTCINFSWWHTALIYEMYNQGCRWDITGLDWYEDCEAVSSVAELMDDVVAHIPDAQFMICETNFWMNLHGRYTEEQKEALKNAETRDKNQAKWIPEFIDSLVKTNNPRLKGVIFYELMDEPAFEEGRGGYFGESHFGFIACDRKGQNRQPKPAFYTLKDKVAEVKGE